MWKNLPYIGCVYFSVIVNAVSIVLILVLKQMLPPVVPLFYGLPAGIEQLIPNIGLVIAPIAGLTVTVINVLVSLFTNDSFLKKTLIISSAFITFLLNIAVIKIILLVGFF